MSRSYGGIYPAVITQYLGGDSRIVLVNIPGLTGTSSAEAVLSVPVGDRPSRTEQRILSADLCWVQFQCGDVRYPVVTGYRTPEAGNEAGYRRWEHTNIELLADDQLNQTGQTISLTATESITLTVGSTSITLTASNITQIAAAIALQGPVTQTGGDLTSDGISQQNHEHTSTSPGSPTSPPIR
jgi:phage baseplate assembly protein gpV